MKEALENLMAVYRKDVATFDQALAVLTDKTSHTAELISMERQATMHFLNEIEGIYIKYLV